MRIKLQKAKRVFSLAVFFSLAYAASTSAQPENDAAVADAGKGISTDQAVVSKGKEIFNANCQQCHAVHEQIVGPKLAGVYERQSVDWLLNFIKYPEKVIQSGDEHAVALYEEYQQVMPNHDFLSDADIMSILAYIQDMTIKGPPAPTASAGTASAGGEVGTVAATSASSDLLIFVIAGLVILLLIMLSVVYMLIATLTKYLKQEENLSETEQNYLTERIQLGKIFKSQPFLVIASFVFTIVLVKVLIDGLFTIGVQQGYAPEQPIAFSHKLHAGHYEIPCVYCHTGVEKAKSANIPSANICMNCHGELRTGSPEIQKIYASIEENKPIQWVRVHNLPDLAYFNHAQHVKVGGIECQTCHGEIEKMEVVQQHSLLTMGWCIACHRKTEVNAKDNEYYDRMLEYHEATSKGGEMKVEDIGGLECSKCHY